MVRRSSPSELDAHLGFWLRKVSNYVSHAFAMEIAAYDVTVAEWVMLRSMFGQAPLAPSRLAETMGMTRGAISKLADRLVAKRLIERSFCSDDRRAQTLALTAQGSALVPELAALADRNDADHFSVLSARERATLEQLLRRIAEHGRIAALPVT